MADRTFDPNTPTELQRQDWTCSIRSVMWMLKSISIQVTPEDAQDAMSPQYVNSDVGLLDASGAGIVAVLRDHWSVEAVNDAATTFDDVVALAGRMPVAIGLRNWGLTDPREGHWSAVRGFDGERLVLANPGGTGPKFGQQTLSREQFDARGPASMVTIPLAAVAPAPPADSSSTSILRGIDVASYQGNPDWAAVAGSGIAFAFTKVTEDNGYTNPTFRRNWVEMRRVGIVRGAYHFARPEENDAGGEASYFLDQIDAAGGLATGDMLALDMEAGSGDLGPWVLDFLHAVERRAGVRPLIYTGAWFSGPHNLAAYPEIGTYGLWLASYQGSQPAPPAPWSEVSIWQHSDKGSVPGISGAVDLNQFRGTRQQLLALGKGGTVVAPEIEYSVGDGIRAAMAARGDEPASSEVYVKTGALDNWSEAMGKSGAIYRWLPAVGRVHRYDPAA